MLLAPLAPPPVLRADDMAASEGRYDVLQYLATGGMAELFLARRVTDDADELCVVKRIQRRYASAARNARRPRAAPSRRSTTVTPSTYSIA